MRAPRQRAGLELVDDLARAGSPAVKQVWRSQKEARRSLVLKQQPRRPERVWTRWQQYTSHLYCCTRQKKPSSTHLLASDILAPNTYLGRW